MADDGRQCAPLSSDLERLQCYDRIFRIPSSKNDDPSIALCEKILLFTLKSPATYIRDNAFISNNKVYITYDAQNSYGALLRASHTCEFSAFKDGFKLSEPKDIPTFITDEFAPYPIPFAATKLDRSTAIVDSKSLEISAIDGGEQMIRSCYEAISVPRSGSQPSDSDYNRLWVQATEFSDGSIKLYIEPKIGQTGLYMGYCYFVDGGMTYERLD